MSSKEKNNRRGFLKAMLIATSAIGATTPLNASPEVTNKEKIKMLTADGKLVEVDKSVIMASLCANLGRMGNHFRFTGRSTFNHHFACANISDHSNLGDH